MQWRDPDIGEGLDPEGPSAEDLDRFGDEFVTCPECGKQIYDQVEICPHCGHAQTRAHPSFKIWVALVAIVLIVVWVWVML